MTDKVQKIREWVSYKQDSLMDKDGYFEYPEDRGAYNVLSELDDYIDSLQEKSVSKQKHSNVERTVKDWKEEPVSEDLEKAAVEAFKQIVDDERNSFLEIFKAGAKWQMSQMIKDAIDVTVHIDAGGYPYIPQLELYDYDKDVPLAKEGDKYKVVLIKED